MKKVKEFLDKYLYLDGESGCELKENGHYNVFGEWHYPKNWSFEVSNENFRTNKQNNKYKSLDHIYVTINNETIIVGNMSFDGIYSKYHYLQTYDHISRGEPDKNGYYKRSTDEEIIKYIKEFYDKIDIVEKRKRKLKKLSDGCYN
jgi:hypothetical protein